mmetsp:Transcript_17661/g.39936  ORF Transcript_17661/g.39936 Transcript_17661/m.39936 type:complete len:257 (+) Transcript_17661:69-839(+)
MQVVHLLPQLLHLLLAPPDLPLCMLGTLVLLSQRLLQLLLLRDELLDPVLALLALAPPLLIHRPDLAVRGASLLPAHLRLLHQLLVLCLVRCKLLLHLLHTLHLLLDVLQHHPLLADQRLLGSSLLGNLLPQDVVVHLEIRHDIPQSPPFRLNLLPRLPRLLRLQLQLLPLLQQPVSIVPQRRHQQQHRHSVPLRTPRQRQPKVLLLESDELVHTAQLRQQLGLVLLQPFQPFGQPLVVLLQPPHRLSCLRLLLHH